MSIVDLLLQMKIPVWIAGLLAAIAAVAMIAYRHVLECRVKQLEQRLQEETINHEKQLDFLQEMHRRKLEALGQVNAAFREFDHAVDHLRGGHPGYAQLLKAHYQEARTLSRRHEDLLGGEFYEAVLTCTDLGESILRSWPASSVVRGTLPSTSAPWRMRCAGRETSVARRRCWRRAWLSLVAWRTRGASGSPSSASGARRAKRAMMRGLRDCTRKA